MKTKLIACLLATSALVACTNQDVGVVTGGVAGGILGNQIGGGTGRVVATTAGALMGAYIGGQVGAHMDAQDRARFARSLEDTRTGQHYGWKNPDTGYAYDVQPTRTYERSHRGSTQPCREYTTTASIGGKAEKVYGTACRMDDGSWKTVS